VLSQVLACNATLGYEEIYNVQVQGHVVVRLRASVANSSSIHGKWQTLLPGSTNHTKEGGAVMFPGLWFVIFQFLRNCLILDCSIPARIHRTAGGGFLHLCRH
jgi:hypothetical protein